MAIRANDSIGFVETRSLVAAIEASDAMVKAAFVTLTGFHKIGGGLVCVTVHGDLASCQAAVAAGRVAAERCGGFLQANVIARPDQNTDTLWTEHMPAMGTRKKERTARKNAEKAAAAKADVAVPAPASKRGKSRKKKE